MRTAWPAGSAFAGTVAIALGVLVHPLLAATAGVVDLKRPPSEGPLRVLTTIVGGEPLEWGGTHLAGGDINGDGIADLVIAAPGGTEDRPSRRGRLYVMYGGVAAPRPSFDRSQRRAPVHPGGPGDFFSQVDLVIDGWDDFDHLGSSLVVADIDGDGFADIVTGAPRADGPSNARPDCGEVYVIHGASTLPRLIELSAGSASGVRINVVIGRSASEAFGTSLEVADLNGDGAPDLIAGAPLAAGSVGAMGAVSVGEVFVISGGASMPELVDLARPPSGSVVCVLRGADAADQAGSALAAGDFDGDGLTDLAIGARGGDGPGNKRPDSGEVYLVFGSRRLASSIELGLQADAFIAPNDIGDLGGGSLAFGDINGDRLADLAIGAESADGWNNRSLDAGDVWVLEGRSRDRLESLRPPPAGQPARTGAETGPVLIDLASPATRDIVTIHGADPGDHTGVRAVVDLDQDGYADLVLGAEDSSSRRNTRAGGGEVRILPGASRLPARISLGAAGGVMIYGPAGGGHLGKSVTAVDLNGDNRPELVIAAPQAGQSLSGSIWVLGGSWKALLKPAGPAK